MNRDEVISTRVTLADRLLLEDYAVRRGQTLADVMRKRLVPWVRLETLHLDLRMEHAAENEAGRRW